MANQEFSVSKNHLAQRCHNKWKGMRKQFFMNMFSFASADPNCRNLVVVGSIFISHNIVMLVSLFRFCCLIFALAYKHVRCSHSFCSFFFSVNTVHLPIPL